MSVYLNGVKVPGHGLQVSASMTIADEDLSGNSSSTAKAEKGDKPKNLSVKTSIKFKNPGELVWIFAQAESRTSQTDRTVFNIINDTAQAMKMRQVRFSGDVQVSENGNLRQWDVSFQLAEYRSVPEKKQERAAAKAKPVTTQKAAGQTVAATPSTPASTEPVVLTQFEQTLKGLNDILK